MNKCPVCGAPQVDKLPFCDNCGNRFPEKRKFSKLCVIGFGIALAAVACCLAGFWCTDFGNVTPFLFKVAVVAYILAIGCCVAGIILSCKGISEVRTGKVKGSPFGIVGIVLSALAGIFVLPLTLIIGCEAIICHAFEDLSSSSGSRYEVPDYTEPPWYTTESETETEPTETEDEPEPQIYTFGSGPEKIELWTYTYEVPEIIEQYIRQNSEFGEMYTVECTFISRERDYERVLDEALANGGDQAPDIYVANAEFVYKYSQGDMAEYSSTYRDLGIDVDKKIEEAEIAPYTVEIGSRDGEVVALGYEGTGCAMIYNAEIARDAFGTDDPAEIEKIIGAGTGDWDKFIDAAEILKSKGYAAVSSSSDIWQLYQTTTDTAWVTDGQLYISNDRLNYLNLAYWIKDNDYSNNNDSWSTGWFDDMSGAGEKKVFAFFGPFWFINYVMQSYSGGDHVGEGTYGQWRVCRPPVGSYWGGTWLFANKNTDQKEGVAELIEWITLDTSESGLQYLWANGDFYGSSYKDGVASAVVMAKANGVSDFCGGQNVYETYIECNNMPSGKNMTQNDTEINSYYKQAVDMYANGDLTGDEAIEYFKNSVYDNVDF